MRLGQPGAKQNVLELVDRSGHLDEPARPVYQLHRLERPTVCVEQAWVDDDHREALRPRDGHVEAVAFEEEVERAGHIFARGARHGEEDDGCR